MPEINLTVNSDQSATDDEVRQLLEPTKTEPSTEPSTEAKTEAKPADFDVDDDDHEERTTKVDAELADANTDSEREAIRERRRQERKDRRERGREKVSSLERMVQGLAQKNQEMAQQLAVLQDSNSGAQLAQVDAAITEANNAAEHFKNIIADATTKGDGRTVAEATEYMINARNRAQQLVQVKQNAVRVTNQPKPLNPAMAKHATDFMSEHKWFNVQSADPDSKVMSAIDNSLTAEGWDPTSEAYWSELRARGSKYLPHRFTNGTKPQAYNGANTRGTKSPVAGSGSNSSSGGSGNVNYGISTERVKAMKDAGIWDDPKRRDAMIKRYRDVDKQANS